MDIIKTIAGKSVEYLKHNDSNFTISLCESITVSCSVIYFSKPADFHVSAA